MNFFDKGIAVYSRCFIWSNAQDQILENSKTHLIVHT